MCFCFSVKNQPPPLQSSCIKFHFYSTFKINVWTSAFCFLYLLEKPVSKRSNVFFFGYFASRSKDLLLLSFWYRWCLQCLLFVVVVVGWIWKKDHWTITKRQREEKNNMLVAGMFIFGQFFSDLTISHNHFKNTLLAKHPILLLLSLYGHCSLFFHSEYFEFDFQAQVFVFLSFTVWFSLCFSLSLSLSGFLFF